MSVAFDTLKLARRLEGAGFTRDQANGAAEALAETFTTEIATKSDIAKLESSIAKVENNVAKVESTLRAEAAKLGADLRTEIASVKTTTAQWIIGAVLVNFAGMAALLFAALRFARP